MTTEFDAAQPAAPSARRQDEKLDHEPSHARTHASRADAIARGVGHWNLATKHIVNLGDVDRRGTHKFPIFYLGRGAYGPRIDARLTGDPAIRLLHAPMVLPASSQPYSENNHFKVDFNPQRHGRFESVLEIDVLESPHERHRVPVVGEAHAPGDPTREEHEETERRQKADEQTRRKNARKTKAEEDRLDKHNERDRHHHSKALLELGRAE